MAQNYPVNLLNEKDLNQFIADIIYFGEKPDSFETAELRDLSYVKEHKDAVIRAMVYQWFKTRLRSFLTTDTKQNRAFLVPLNPWSASYHELLEQYTPDGQEPLWLRSCYEQGRTVYVFNQEKMPSEIKDEITNLRDFLYDDASKKVERAITVAEESQQGKKQKGGFRLRLDTLKTDNKYKEYEQAKKASEIWHYKLTVQSAKLKNVYRDERGEEEIIQFADGMKIVRLFTPEALDYEGKKMGHCVGSGNYDKGIMEGSIQIYSLRDKRDNPHVTFEVRGKDIKQCKGKENCHPIRKYAPYCQFFVNQNGLNLCEDMRQLGLINQDGICYDLYELPEHFVIKGNLDLSRMGLEVLPDLSHVVVEGDFDCRENLLKNLKGAPGVRGKIYVDKNEIETLEGYRFYQDGKWYDLYHLPENFVIKGDLNLDVMRVNSGLTDIPMWTLPNLSGVIVAGDFVCSNSRLRNFKECPKVKGRTIARWNPIETLEGYRIYQDGEWYDICHLPENFVIKGDLNLSEMCLGALPDLSDVVVEGNFDCRYNRLRNFKGCPRVKGKIKADGNQIETLEGYRIYQDGKWYDICHLPEHFVIKGSLDLRRMNLTVLPDLSDVVVEGNFNCSGNELISLSGSPQKVGGNFNCSGNYFVSLQGAPEQVGGDFRCFDCRALKSGKGAPKLLGGKFICDERQLESKPVYENGKLKDSAVVKIKSPLSHAR